MDRYANISIPSGEKLSNLNVDIIKNTLFDMEKEILFLREKMMDPIVLGQFNDKIRDFIYKIRENGISKIDLLSPKEEYLNLKKESKKIKSLYYNLKNSKNRKERRFYKAKIRIAKEYKKKLSEFTKIDISKFYILIHTDELLVRSGDIIFAKKIFDHNGKDTTEYFQNLTAYARRDPVALEKMISVMEGNFGYNIERIRFNLSKIEGEIS